MKDAFDAVTEFHRAYGQEAPDAPRFLDPATQNLRFDLIKEEFDEYVAACKRGDMVGIADALADLAYVVLGAAVAHGIRRFPEIFAEVHRSNMSKLGPDGKPIRRTDGKILKGPDYSPPRIAAFLAPAPTAEEIVATLRAHEPELRRAGIRHLSLFGSMARGEAKPESDIDLAAELDRGAHIGLFALVALERRLSEILDRRVDLLPEPVKNPRLQARIDRDRRRAF